MSMSNAIRDDASHLGLSYFRVLKAGLRRDMTKASEYFAVPDGQLRYLLQDVPLKHLEELAAFGLPFRFAQQGRGLGSGVRHILASARPQGIEELEGWEREALSLACDTWWVMRDWAHQDPAMASLHCGLRTREQTAELAELRASEVRALAERTFQSMHLIDTVCMQLAYVFCDAEAASDRIAVVRGSCPLVVAA